MDIDLKHITIGELANGYEDNDEGGVKGYDGKLDIRPPYQREFIYGPKERDAVINTVTKGYPLNVMYWAVREDGNFEIIDGQQRTISVCQYVKGDFSFNKLYFENLQDDQQKQILDYELTVYLCSGTNSEKLEWFKTINIAGKELTNQELRNAVYHGSWVSDAKKWFSKSGCPASGIASDYLNGSPIRQDYLETAIKWISDGKIEEYMAEHQKDQNASELWQYFENVIKWVAKTFTTKRKKIMKGVEWGPLYNQFKNKKSDTDKLEKRIHDLILDEEVQNQKGIYPFVLTGDEKHLNLRTFPDAIKMKVYEKQKGKCVMCKKHFELSEMEADHIDPWSKGGKTVEENCQMLCKQDNRRKSAK